ncbi:hypothetical protein ACWV26_13095 [Rummeliibacillus sp. JY-2-4R]
MSDQKKEVILNEIIFWKNNKLLPEHYCDFLITLYSGGIAEDSKVEVSATNSILHTKREKHHWKKLLISFCTIVLFSSLFAFKVPFVLIPLILSVCTIIYLLFLAFKYTSTKTIMATFTYATVALLILGVSIKLVNIMFPDRYYFLYGVLLGNCLLWAISGKLLNLIYFKISGIIGFIIIIFYIVFK